jgi:small subunit ribosomal protein S12
MATLNQLIKSRKKIVQNKKLLLVNCPQKKAVCLRLFILTPKKPNSAQRKVARVRLSTGQEISAFIPGEGHSLQEHSVVLVRGGRVKDLPGVKHKLIRGKFDLLGITGRKRGRSKYGTKAA